jgi:hypothetical protein
MSRSKSNRERLGLGLLLSIAMLMFVSPLVNLHGAFAGDETANGLNVGSALSLLRSGLDASTAQFTANQGHAPVSAPEGSAAAVSLRVPLSIQSESTATMLIFAALACSALALLDLFSIQKGITALSFAGGVFGALAIAQLVIMNDGMHRWTAQLIDSGAFGSPRDPFVAMRVLIARSFELVPGPGLYLLTACLFLVSALSYSSAIQRIESVMRSSPRIAVAASIRVRPIDPQYTAEICTTRDISRAGLYFHTPIPHYYSGMEIGLTRDPDSVGLGNEEERGSVVRVDRLKGGMFGVAVRVVTPAPKR